MPHIDLASHINHKSTANLLESQLLGVITDSARRIGKMRAVVSLIGTNGNGQLCCAQERE